MSRIAFFSLPAHGHVNPTLPLVAELIRRGEQVDYYAVESFRSRIEHAGARFRPLPCGDLEVVDQPPNLFWLARRQMEICHEVLPPLHEELRRDPPDLLVHESMCTWGLALGRILELPTVSTFTTFASKPEHLPPTPVFVFLFGLSSIPSSLRNLHRFDDLSRELARRFGVPRFRLGDIVSNRGHLNLVFTSTEFQVRREAFDESFVFVGPCIADRPLDPDFPLGALDGKSVIYASLGTVFNANAAFFRSCIEAFAGTDHTVVMSIGQQIDPRDLGEIPRNFIVRQAVPQLEVLKRARVFITHGGMNSVSEGLYFKVPLLVHPQGADQFLVARRVKEVGAGRVLRGADLGPPRLRALAEQAMEDEGTRRSLEYLSHSLRASGGKKRAADEVIAFRRRGAGDPRR